MTTTETNSAVLDLARLACDQGAAFDVAYEADGVVRVSMYPQTLEDRMAKAMEFSKSLTVEQYARLKQMVVDDIRDGILVAS